MTRTASSLTRRGPRRFQTSTWIATSRNANRDVVLRPESSGSHHAAGDNREGFSYRGVGGKTTPYNTTYEDKRTALTTELSALANEPKLFARKMGAWTALKEQYGHNAALLREKEDEALAKSVGRDSIGEIDDERRTSLLKAYDKTHKVIKVIESVSESTPDTVSPKEIESFREKSVNLEINGKWVTGAGNTPNYGKLYLERKESVNKETGEVVGKNEAFLTSAARLIKHVWKSEGEQSEGRTNANSGKGALGEYQAFLRGLAALIQSDGSFTGRVGVMVDGKIKILGNKDALPKNLRLMKGTIADAKRQQKQETLSGDPMGAPLSDKEALAEAGDEIRSDTDRNIVPSESTSLEARADTLLAEGSLGEIYRDEKTGIQTGLGLDAEAFAVGGHAPRSEKAVDSVTAPLATKPVERSVAPVTDDQLVALEKVESAKDWVVSMLANADKFRDMLAKIAGMSKEQLKVLNNAVFGRTTPDTFETRKAVNKNRGKVGVRAEFEIVPTGETHTTVKHDAGLLDLSPEKFASLYFPQNADKGKMRLTRLKNYADTIRSAIAERKTEVEGGRRSEANSKESGSQLEKPAGETARREDSHGRSGRSAIAATVGNGGKTVSTARADEEVDTPTGKVKQSRLSADIHKVLGKEGLAATHDSPIRHEGKFNWREHKGKGEGAAAFGAGTYLSTADGVHESYKNQFTGQLEEDAESVPVDFLNKQLERQLRQIDSLAVKGQVRFNQLYMETSNFHDSRGGELMSVDAAKKLINDRIAENSKTSYKENTSPTYHVTVKATPEELLDWDSDFSDQSELVKNVLRNAGLAPKKIEKILWNKNANGEVDSWTGFVDEKTKGKKIYENLVKDLGSQTAASDYLQSLGIVGHKYAASGGKNDAHPNYVIYDDSRIETNYVSFNAQNADIQGRQASQEEVDAAVKHLTDTLGDSVKVDFKKWFGDNSSGRWTERRKRNLIELALNGDVLGTAYHESLHEFFNQLGRHGAENVQALLKRVATNKVIMRQLHKLLKDHEKAIEQLSDPEEALAYMYQFWRTGLLKIGPETQTFFEKVANWLRHVFNRVQPEVRDMKQAELLLRAFSQGAIKESATKASVIEAMRGDTEAHDRAIEALGKGTNALVDALGKLTFSAEAIMERTGNKHMVEIVRMANQKAGEAMRDKQAYFDAVHAAKGRWMNKLQNILTGHEADVLNIAREALNTETPTHHPGAKALAANVRMRQSIRRPRRARPLASEDGSGYSPNRFHYTLSSRWMIGGHCQPGLRRDTSGRRGAVFSHWTR